MKPKIGSRVQFSHDITILENGVYPLPLELAGVRGTIHQYDYIINASKENISKLQEIIFKIKGGYPWILR